MLPTVSVLRPRLAVLDKSTRGTHSPRPLRVCLSVVSLCRCRNLLCVAGVAAICYVAAILLDPASCTSHYLRTRLYSTKSVSWCSKGCSWHALQYHYTPRSGCSGSERCSGPCGCRARSGFGSRHCSFAIVRRTSDTSQTPHLASQQSPVECTRPLSGIACLADML